MTKEQERVFDVALRRSFEDAYDDAQLYFAAQDAEEALTESTQEEDPEVIELTRLRDAWAVRSAKA